jgi:hypothetical protein
MSEFDITKQQLKEKLSNIDDINNELNRIYRELKLEKEKYDSKHKEYIIQNKKNMFDKNRHDEYMEDINNYLRHLFCDCRDMTELNDQNITLDISLDINGNLNCNNCYIRIYGGVYPVDQAKGTLGFRMEIESLLKEILEKSVTMTLQEYDYDQCFCFCESHKVTF